MASVREAADPVFAGRGPGIAKNFLNLKKRAFRLVFPRGRGKAMISIDMISLN
jgi:hypothetical protein